jgi:hypothetical protein
LISSIRIGRSRRASFYSSQSPSVDCEGCLTSGRKAGLADDRKSLVADLVVRRKVKLGLQVDPFDASTRYKLLDVDRPNCLQFNEFQVLVRQNDVVVLTTLVALGFTALRVRSSGSDLLLSRGFDDAHDVAFLHDQQVFAVDLDPCARPLAEQDAIASVDVERLYLAGVVTRGRDPRQRLRPLTALGFDPADKDAIVKRSERHVFLR